MKRITTLVAAVTLLCLYAARGFRSGDDGTRPQGGGGLEKSGGQSRLVWAELADRSRD